MTKIVRRSILSFIVGSLTAVRFFFSYQGTSYDLFASVLGGPGLQHGEVTYDVSLHGDDDQLWIVSHRDFSSATALEMLFLFRDDVLLKLDEQYVDSIDAKQDTGMLKLIRHDVLDWGENDEMIRVHYQGNIDDIVLSDVKVTVTSGDSETLSVYNTVMCMGEECTH